jgi:hypothetical protein
MLAIKRHDVFQTRDVSRESQEYIPSRWTLFYLSKLLCIECSYCALHQGPEESGVDSKSTMMGSTCRDRQLQCSPKSASLSCRSFQATVKCLVPIKLEAGPQRCLPLYFQDPLFCDHPTQLLSALRIQQISKDG